MTESTVKLTCERDPSLDRAMNSLSELAERSPELVHRFLRGRNAGAELLRIDENLLATAGADEVRIVLQPSQCLLDFLATAGAGNGNRV